eukprot:TRINITY_DN26753_c0_g2_i1.p1 TRINITY_DN26753_c0_g2~~TRINITY_DN26753_c0_g2_i1.p1  ORF type:complete len:276 (-),score=12.88 TRINITY_DN26753_c0_g2_i1:358-1185(-)
MQARIGETASEYNSTNTDDTDFSVSAIYKSFYLNPVEMLLIVTKDGRCTLLKLPARKPLVEFYKSSKPVYLEYLDGAKDPLELATGIKDVEFIEPVWRINTFGDTRKFRCRLGGYFRKIYNTSSYGVDANGKIVSAEMAGFGVEDKHWAKYTKGMKSFGVRQAYDHSNSFGNDSLGNAIGQLASAAIINMTFTTTTYALYLHEIHIYKRDIASHGIVLAYNAYMISRGFKLSILFLIMLYVKTIFYTCKMQQILIISSDKIDIANSFIGRQFLTF